MWSLLLPRILVLVCHSTHINKHIFSLDRSVSVEWSFPRSLNLAKLFSKPCSISSTKYEITQPNTASLFYPLEENKSSKKAVWCFAICSFFSPPQYYVALLKLECPVELNSLRYIIHISSVKAFIVNVHLSSFLSLLLHRCCSWLNTGGRLSVG